MNVGLHCSLELQHLVKLVIVKVNLCLLRYLRARRASANPPAQSQTKEVLHFEEQDSVLLEVDRHRKKTKQLLLRSNCGVCIG